MTLPLEGIKVVDYTGVQAGPACSQMMAWFGADVLKVERMHTGCLLYTSDAADE